MKKSILIFDPNGGNFPGAPMTFKLATLLEKAGREVIFLLQVRVICGSTPTLMKMGRWDKV